MYSEAYKEWIEVFNDDLLEIWQKERKELQKASMLLCALQKEFKNIQNDVEAEIINIKQQVICKDNLLRNKRNSLSPYNERKKNSLNTINKENECNSEVTVTADILEHKSNLDEIESPDLFKNIVSQCSTETSVIDLSVSDEDITNDDGSPTIKRRRRHYNKNKLGSPALVNYGHNNESKKTISTPTKIVRNKNLVKANLFKTPIVKSDNDLSVIENTPEVITKKLQTTSKVVGKMSRKKPKSVKAANTTLTQMMGRAKKKLQLTTNKNADCGEDSDETYFEDTKGGSEMGITDLLGYINKDSTSILEEKSDVVERVNDDTTYYEVNMNSSEEVDEFSKGAIFNETEIATSSEKPKVIALEPEPIVRGKARKQLQGWACEKCKNFYGTMKLSAEELKKRMDECSRHRYKYHPPQDTLPGFWDLSIPPEEPK